MQYEVLPRITGQLGKDGPRLKTNIPVPLTALVGREHAVQDISALLRRSDVRLLTLTGTGGIGKTRLCMQVALNLANDFPDGIYFVPLAPITDSALVLLSIAQALNMSDVGERSLLERLQEFLGEKCLLLLLDNFEQILSAAPQLVALLVVCPAVKMLVTSRALLHIRGEYEYAVPPLSIPDTKSILDLETLAQNAAVQLFMQRASAIKPGFQLDQNNARIIRDICVRLEGIPLAIELAAAQSKLLPPRALLARLSHRLQVLTGGARDLPVRQQTLRDTIKWSYELLSPDEQCVFRRLSIFASGCTLEAAEKLCKDANITTEVFTVISALIDKSLLRQVEQTNGEPRLLMLETIREYGLETLNIVGELEMMQQRHALYALELAEEAEQMSGAEQIEWSQRLDYEQDNMRAALRWFIEHEENEYALRLSVALYWFWSLRGYLGEGRQWLERALMSRQGVSPAILARALNFAGALAYNEDERERVEELCGESLRLCHSVGNTQGAAVALYWLGLVACWYRHDFPLASQRAKEALALFKQVNDGSGVADSFLLLAFIAINQGDYGKARSLLEAGLSLFRQQQDKWGIAYTLNYLARATFALGDIHTTRQFLEESVSLSRALGYQAGTAYALTLLGQLSLKQGDALNARCLLEESVTLHRESGGGTGLVNALFVQAKIALFEKNYLQARAYYEEAADILFKLSDQDYLMDCMEGLATVCVAEQQFQWAAHLLGAADHMRQERSLLLSPLDVEDHEHTITSARFLLGETAFTLAYAEGQQMTPAQALVRPINAPTISVVPAAQHQDAPHDADEAINRMPVDLPAVHSKEAEATSVHPLATELTGREIEVLRALATGLTNGQIARKLGISTPTVNAHVRSIYSKLEVNSRSAATRYAIEHKLV